MDIQNENEIDYIEIETLWRLNLVKKNEIGSKINPFGASALSDWAGAEGIIWKLIISHIGGPVDLSIYY